MDRDLSLDLHALTARLDRAADRILRTEYNVSYHRFLALFTMAESAHITQRALAERLGVTEQAVSRMTGVLAAAGLLDVQPDPAGGNRRRVELPMNGHKLVGRCREALEGRLAELVEASGVPYDDYARHTRQLLATLNSGERNADRGAAPLRAAAVEPASNGRTS